MTEKNKTLSVRIEEFRYDFLKDLAAEQDVNVSDLQRTHLEQISRGVEPSHNGYRIVEDEVDEEYRQFVNELQDGEVETLDEFVDEHYEEALVLESDDEFVDAMEDLVLYADADKYDEAEDLVDEWRGEGYDREAFLMELVLNQYQR